MARKAIFVNDRHKVAKLIRLKHQHYTGKQLREIRAKKGVGRATKGYGDFK